MSLLLASLFLSLLAVGAAWLATRRDPAGSPLLTLGSLLILLALPLLMLLPKVPVEIAATRTQAAALSGTTIPLFVLLWLAGFLFCAVKLTRDYLALRRWFAASAEISDPGLRGILQETCRQLGITRPVRLHLCQGNGSPCVAGLIHPVVYLPQDSATWSEETLRMVLLHELSHFARRDLWTSLAARLACLVHWFNPLVWGLRRHLLAQCEYATDAHVIAAGADPSTYVDALCDVAEGPQHLSTSLAMAGSAPLRHRVERLTKPHRRQHLLVAATLLATAVTSLALSVVRFAPAPEPGVEYSAEEINLRLSADPFPGE